jgi:hypothetical protein
MGGADRDPAATEELEVGVTRAGAWAAADGRGSLIFMM